MTKNSIHHDSIEKYLDNTLPANERELFDERLKTDPALSKELADRTMIQKSWVKVAKHHQIKQHIGQVIAKEKQKRKILSSRWLAAASVVVILGIGTLVLLQNIKNYNDQEFLFSGKGINNDEGRKLIQGRQNEAIKYGSADSLEIPKTEIFKRYSPADHAVFKTYDTIHFTWPAKDRREKLIILDQKGSMVLEMPIQKGSNEYLLLPSRLQPGTYSWSLLTDKLKHRFSIKN